MTQSSTALAGSPFVRSFSVHRFFFLLFLLCFVVENTQFSLHDVYFMRIRISMIWTMICIDAIKSGRRRRNRRSLWMEIEWEESAAYRCWDVRVLTRCVFSIHSVLQYLLGLHGYCGRYRNWINQPKITTSTTTKNNSQLIWLVWFSIWIWLWFKI